MMSRPGERRMDRAAAWLCFFDDAGDDLMNLRSFSTAQHIECVLYSQMQSIYQYKLSDEHSCPLEVDCLPAVIVQVLNLQHLRVNQLCSLRHGPFEVRKERRVIERPF